MQGIYNGEHFSGACRGDDGGPLTVEVDGQYDQYYIINIINVEVDGQTTLVGIVSGGLGCGNGIPNWYTRVSFYEEWIACIQEKSRELKTFVQVSLDNKLAQKKNEKSMMKT